MVMVLSSKKQGLNYGALLLGFTWLNQQLLYMNGNQVFFRGKFQESLGARFAPKQQG